MPGANHAAGPVTLGIRPEHLVHDEAGPIRISVLMSEHLGATTLIHGVLEGTDTDFVASMLGHVTADPGSTMSFSASSDNLHIFDASSGKRIEG